MKIYFARHGESRANVLHEISNRGLRHGLTRRGREQAFALAQSLKDKAVTHIYSSPVLRAIETSIIAAHQLDLEYEVVDSLREYDCGLIEGCSDEGSWRQWQDLFDAWTIHKQWERRIEGGETFLEIRDRFVPFIEGLISRFGDTRAEVLCISHGGVYWMMLPLVLKNVDLETIAQHGFDYTSCIVAELRPAGLVCVGWNGRTMEE